MSSRDSLDEWQCMKLSCGAYGIITPICPACGYEKGYIDPKIHQWALDIIGEDEDVEPARTEYGEGSKFYTNIAERNRLRASQRAKLKGDIDED